ncbi:YesL family protein [Kribbella deserti]|uniref:YesL family protein n=1 Tax=Kribbella deserti TaxID=1926257 RepID=A0ABV6QHH6_9ACTN
MTLPAWGLRLYEAADELFWAFTLTLLWITFTLAGGIVFGIGPATVAAYTVARRRASGESFQAWPAYLSAYRREFVRGSLLVLPLAGAFALLVANYFWFATLGSAAAVPRLITVAALIALTLVSSYLLPMFVHYDLPARAYLPKASLFALTRPASSVVLLFVLASVVYLGNSFPFLGLVLAVGGWIQLDTWLCLRFFAENEARLQAKGIS